jgi:transposase
MAGSIRPIRKWSRGPSDAGLDKSYKRGILRQIAACTQEGQIGEILRREGLYSSIVCIWRQKEKQGLLDTSASGKPATLEQQGSNRR